MNKAVSVLCAVVLVATLAPAAARHATKKSSGNKTAVKSASSSNRAVKSTKSKASSTTKSRRSASARKGKRTRQARRRPRGQQVIDSNRTREIQQALIREHYLSGEPTGVWDDATKRALVRYQSENGWQSKIVPDSRALIKLGLGPRHEGLLNPDSAVLGNPHALGAERDIPGGAAMSGGAAPNR